MQQYNFGPRGYRPLQEQLRAITEHCHKLQVRERGWHSRGSTTPARRPALVTRALLLLFSLVWFEALPSLEEASG